MKWAAILARFGLTSAIVATPQTLAAANRRQREALEAARAGLLQLGIIEAALPPGPDHAALRTERIRFEAESERLRMRVEFFRSDRLATGAGVVYGTSASRSGDTLAALTAETTALLRDVEAALERARAAEMPPEP